MDVDEVEVELVVVVEVDVLADEQAAKANNIAITTNIEINLVIS